MASKNTLGIVVNSNRYFEFVTQMTDAALGRDKQVRICLLGSGIEYTRTNAYARLSRKIRVSLCGDRGQTTACLAGSKPGGYGNLVPLRELTSILQNCDRYVVF